METQNPEGLAKSRGRGALTFLKELVETILIGAAVLLVLQASVRNFRVVGSSMEPSLFTDQRLLVNKIVYWHFPIGTLAQFIPFVRLDREAVFYPFHPPRRGEVVVFRFPKDPKVDFIKRIIATAGDTVAVREGVVYLNGQPIEEPFVAHQGYTDMAPIKVPNGSYFVMGDNRPSSNDSRDWGPVSAGYIIGKAWFRYWPSSEMGLIGSAPVHAR
ncbi:MAG: signal peptidase I [Chloroflexi bacterium]|nr:signal peptidase I [Chloroflexota bacterium]